MFKKKKENIVVIITAYNRSFSETVAEPHARVSRSPEYYRDIHFVLDSPAAIEPYRDHFVYRYLETLNKTGDLPRFILKAEKLEITVRKAKE